MPYIGKSPHFGVRNRFIYTASASDTSVSGADANGATLTFADGAYVDVYLNGILLKAGTDYVTTTANTIGSISAMDASDEVVVIVYDVFSVSDTVSAASGGTFSGAVTVNGALSAKGGAVFNEDSADVDFRVESNGNANMIFVDGGNDKVGIGTASPNDYYAKELVVNSTDEGGITILNSSTHAGGLFFADGTSANAYRAYVQYDHNTDAMVIATAATVRLDIKSDGLINQYSNRAGALAYIQNAASSGPYGIAMDFSAAAPDNTDNYFIAAEDSSTNRFKIFSDGDMQNHDNSYGALSDQRLKQNIVDSNSQWDDIKAVKVRNFKKKDDVAQYGDKAWSQIGVVAQELETVSPKLIRECNPDVGDVKIDASFGTLVDDTDRPFTYYEDGDDIPDGKKIGDAKTYKKKVGEVKSKVKSVNYSILYMKAVKALQEAMTRIETLETKVKALEDA